MKKSSILIPFLLIFAAFLFLQSCSEDDTPTQTVTTGTIQGKVTDANNGTAINNATVVTNPPTSSVSTNSSGEYTISDVTAGTYTVTASKTGCADCSVNVSVVAGKTTTANIQMVSTTITDIDGNVYQTIVIGTQTWMAENLKVTHYRNGDDIPYNYHNTNYEGAYSIYDNNSYNKDVYGLLYNWAAVNEARKIAPIGWHVPSTLDWDVLFNYLGGSDVAGGKLKEAGTAHWIEDEYNATNSSGFTALPGGQNHSYGFFSWMYYYGYFWSSNSIDAENAYLQTFRLDSKVTRDQGLKSSLISVRCVKDQ